MKHMKEPMTFEDWLLGMIGSGLALLVIYFFIS